MRILPQSKQLSFSSVAKINKNRLVVLERKGTIIPKNYQTWQVINRRESLNQTASALWREDNCVDGSFLDKPVSQKRASRTGKEETGGKVEIQLRRIYTWAWLICTKYKLNPK